MKKTTLLISLLTALLLIFSGAQEDPFKKALKKDPNKNNVTGHVHNPVNILQCFEVFSIPLVEAHKLQKNNPTDEEIYEQLIAGLNTEKTTQEFFIILKGKSGDTITSISVFEYFHPIKWTTKESNLKKKNKVQSTSPQQPTRTTTATNFDLVPIGLTIESCPTLGANQDTVDLDLALLSRALTSEKHLKKFKFAKFKIKNMTDTLTTFIDRPLLIDSFEYFPNSKAVNEPTDTVYFVFVTTSLDKIR